MTRPAKRETPDKLSELSELYIDVLADLFFHSIFSFHFISLSLSLNYGFAFTLCYTTPLLAPASRPLGVRHKVQVADVQGQSAPCPRRAAGGPVRRRARVQRDGTHADDAQSGPRAPRVGCMSRQDPRGDRHVEARAQVCKREHEICIIPKEARCGMGCGGCGS